MSRSDAVAANGAPICADCEHINRGSCVRPIGKHFNAGVNGYRSRLNVGAAMERARRKTLDGRPTCGPEGQFFERKGSHAPMVPVVRPRDTIADSDGDDGA